MPRLDNQITLADVDPEYQGFLDKFKPKKTTDDCYTPDNIYDVVLKWVIDTYGIDPDKVVRPFWPAVSQGPCPAIIALYSKSILHAAPTNHLILICRQLPPFEAP